MSGSFININDSGYTGYLAVPPDGQGPGLILIQEIFGVNSHIRDCADLYALAGYTVLAPDVFWRVQPKVELGYTPADMQQGIELAGKLQTEEALGDMKLAIEKLKSQPQCTGKVGSVGYCLGGSYSYRLATHSFVDAAVCYYGGHIGKHLDEVKNIRCPIILHFGELDKHIPMTEVDKIRQALQGKDRMELYTYDADHGFNCDQRATYDRRAAMLAFARTAIFLNKHLN